MLLLCGVGFAVALAVTGAVTGAMATALGAAGAQNCGDLVSAIANYEYVLNNAPHFSSWARNLYSYALVESGDFDKALKFFEIELQKDHAFGGFSQTMYLLSAYINKKRGNEKKAKELFEKQKSEDGNSAQRHDGVTIFI